MKSSLGVRLYYLWVTPSETRILFIQGKVVRSSNNFFIILSGTTTNPIYWKFSLFSPIILGYEFI